MYGVRVNGHGCEVGDACEVDALRRHHDRCCAVGHCDHRPIVVQVVIARE